jgi:hypothetical protein
MLFAAKQKKSGCCSGIRMPGSLSPVRLVERAALQDTMLHHVCAWIAALECKYIVDW